VTVLTSLGKDDLKRTGVITGVENQVVRLAKLAKEAGMDGVVASPLEISRIRRECGKNFLLVVRECARGANPGTIRSAC